MFILERGIMKKKKLIKDSIIFLILVLLTFYVIFHNNNPREVFGIVKSIKTKDLVYAGLAMPIYFALEGISLNIGLHLFGYKPKFLNTYKYAVSNFFFSSLSPGSSAGKPMQIYYMVKDNIKMSHSTIVSLFELTSFVFSNVVLSLIGFFFNLNLITSSLNKLMYLIYLSLFLNILYLSLLIVLLFWKDASKWIIKSFINILKYFKYKKVDIVKQKSYDYLNDFQECAKYIKKNPFQMFLMIIFTLSKLVVLNSVPYFVYLGFGLSGYSYLTIMLLESVLCIMMTIVPLPGSVGANESSFVILFKLIFPASLISEAMIICRFADFYSYVIITGLILLIIRLTKEEFKFDKK
jgi:glycosyltransferase 2 family protein